VRFSHLPPALPPWASRALLSADDDHLGAAAVTLEGAASREPPGLGAGLPRRLRPCLMSAVPGQDVGGAEASQASSAIRAGTATLGRCERSLFVLALAGSGMGAAQTSEG
jgi:hypothetical protein